VRILLLSAALLGAASCAVPPPGAPALAPPELTAAPPRLEPAPIASVAPTAREPVALAAPVGVVVPVAAPRPPVVAAAPVTAPPPVVVAVSAPPPPPLIVIPLPFFAALQSSPPPAGRLTLSNFNYDKAHVVAIVTRSPDCGVRVDGDAESIFELPLNGTRIIGTASGADVCFRREVEASEGSPRHWSDWSRVYTSTGRSIDSQL